MANATYADTESARETLVEHFLKYGMFHERQAPNLRVINTPDQSYTYDTLNGTFYIEDEIVNHGEIYEALLQI